MANWCGESFGFWWVFPVICIVMVMGMAFFVGFRRRSWMGRPPGPATDAVGDLRRQVQALQEEVAKLSRNPS